ncbi:MAG TPA: hypothetical protein VMA09_15955 [Candidatus Binataceae bacterium]|nr:hypothetical protein [Candidatus Binataceae bacterium]
MVRNSILWIHAGAGAIWIAACACFVIAGLAIEDGTSEQSDFVRRTIGSINRLASVAAAIVIVTGAANIVFYSMMHDHMRAAFVFVLTAKLAIFGVMAAALAITVRAATRARGMLVVGNRGALPGAIRRMVRAHFAMVALGSVALVLGLWLSGT